MPDYGLPLHFGTFITPVNRPHEAPIALAQLSEQLGFDLVTFQDHPYQPTFADTWTLMTWVAAQTTTIHIAPNVLNVPMRPPAVVARSAVTLDLLSSGRFDLALGAGGFWDAIEAMGGRKLTPGQGVDALGEAIDVIRGIWDVDDRTPLRLPGKYYHLNGARRGPAAAHDIPIWIGARKPRMLRLTGSKGDGWLPSLGWLEPGDLAAGNAIIDEAAAGAGRDAREIRRLLNIGPNVALEQLVSLALEDGIATFIVASDDPRTLQQFAEETIPALREAVDAERATAGTSTAAPKRASVLAKRRDGIDYDGIPELLRAGAIEPGDRGYAAVKSTYLRGGAPGLVLKVRSTAEVVEALSFARKQPVALAVRSAGHGISGRSTNDGGIVIDVGALNDIEVLDVESRRVRIGPGARWMDVANVLGQHGWALSSGDYGGVGVGGLATAGGIGYLVREHGLTIDHLRAVEIVLADGTVTRASADENAELFWAVRGAGANFGIVTSFEFEVDEVGEVGWAQLVFDATDIADFLVAWGAAVEAAPRDLTSFLIMGAPRRGQPTIAQTMTVVDSSDPEVIIDRLQPLAAIAPLLDQAVELKPYSAIMANAPLGEPEHNAQGEPLARSGLIEHLTPEFAAAAAVLLQSGESYFFSIRSAGGAVSDVAEDATAYAHRSANFSVAAFGSHPERFTKAWDELASDHFSGLYLSFEADQRPERLEEAFPPATLARLRELKARLDPDNLFRDNFNITQVAVG
jgi:alkanesulfonate monooxygenase SsuD/methylene tetrahydromethanopterin reductase-like flavin-dependent oxidoreductase (luciferase family)/FAD/FMN-containing dehydrogenase